MVIRNKIDFLSIQSFSFNITYVEIDALSPENVFQSHIHNECEIYFNLSGDVSFMVENKVYPISPGSIILTRPNEFHHCIYNSAREIHRHFCILFSPGENETFLDVFFNRNSGENNLIILNSLQADQFKELCFSMIKKDAQPIEQYYNFFSVLTFLKNGNQLISPHTDISMPEDTAFALEYIHNHLSLPITINELAQQAHVSLNTLERHFLTSIQMTPSQYIKRRRLANAQILLKEGKTVQEACSLSGFSDYSHFIALFKKSFGMTPYQYRKLSSD